MPFSRRFRPISALLLTFCGALLTYSAPAGAAEKGDEAPDVESSADVVQAEKVNVHIESDHEDTILYRYLGTSQGYGSVGGRTVSVTQEQYSPVCTAPCTVRLNSQTYYSVGGGVTGTGTFRIEPGTTKISIEGGSRLKRGFGVASLTLGVTGVITGGTLAVLSSVLPTYGKDTSTQDTLGTIGWATLGIGAGFTALGIVMIATSGTTVNQEREATLKVLGWKLPGNATLTPSGAVVF